MKSLSNFGSHVGPPKNHDLWSWGISGELLQKLLQYSNGHNQFINVCYYVGIFSHNSLLPHRIKTQTINLTTTILKTTTQFLTHKQIQIKSQSRGNFFA
eukprot:m.88576 g.88576  ORF g.88576 m.88576 type:complete len:99 (+) comp26212_c1_seq1:257-553(+)